METLITFFRNLFTRFQELSSTNKGIALALLALILGSLFTMALWIQAPDYQLLYANLSREDAAEIVEQLKAQKIPFELTNGERNIHVPGDKVHELRLSLASEGLPHGSEVGLELFEDTPLGMTEFVQKLNFQRALQGELARTIKSLDAVEQARVHLVLPKEELFSRKKPQGKASVMLKLRAGRSLTESQIQGIVYLVSSSVEGVPASGVVVVDFKGNMLSGQKEASETTLMTASNYKHKKKVEQELETSVVRMLEEALGPGKVVARVTADLNFDKVERTEEIFDPDSQVVRSEQNVNESMVGAQTPGGVAGVQSLSPEGGGGSAGKGSPSKKTNEKSTFNYEINKVVKHVTESTGEIRKLFVSVLVDGTMSGSPPQYQARTPEEMGKFLEIVKTAVGFDEKRGDQIKLENVQFDKSLELQRAEELAREQLWENGITAAKIIGGVIILVLFILKILLPMVRWVTTSVEVMPEEAPEPSPEELEAEEEQKRLAKVNQELVQIRNSVNEFVESDPKYAAGILRKWLRERG